MKFCLRFILSNRKRNLITQERDCAYPSFSSLSLSLCSFLKIVLDHHRLEYTLNIINCVFLFINWPDNFFFRSFVLGENNVVEEEEEGKGQEEAEEGEIDFSAPMVKFPRRNEKDPYKRLGLTADSSFEEVQEARNFLVKEYMRDVDGCEQIDLAMDAILKEKLNTRKKSKGLKRKNLRQKKEEEDYTPPFVERIKNQFEKPDKTTLMRRAVLYFGISIWSIVTPASQGPAFQLACAFAACVFFLNDKRGGQKNKALGKSFLHTFAAMLVGWLIGSIIPVYIPLFPESFSPELILSLFSFLTLFVTCTFLK